VARLHDVVASTIILPASAAGQVTRLLVRDFLISEPEDDNPDAWPGSYMHRGLQYRDQWEQAPRTSRWSPLR
jgi:hypothetical protein